MIKRLLLKTNSLVFNLDKLTHCSDLTQINILLKRNKDLTKRYFFKKVDLANEDETKQVIRETDPDIIFHLAAESHVDNSIRNPKVFIKSNILGTFNLLEATLKHFEGLNQERKNDFRFHHISTDEVFGTLGIQGSFNEESKYDPRSPYSASKASSDHLVKSWHYTYGLPTVLTNCSNNFGPWQYPEKLIPLSIFNALNEKDIRIYGDGSNIRDWLYVEDHIDGIILSLIEGEVGKNYCIGGNSELTNLKLAKLICDFLDQEKPKSQTYHKQISFVEDRPGHDFRYSIDSTFIRKTLGWEQKNELVPSLHKTFKWYLENQKWLKMNLQKI